MKIKLLLMLCLAVSQLIAQQTELKLASDAWPPFTDIEGNKSILTDLVHKALQRTDVKASTVILDFGDVLDKIGTDYDGSVALWKTDERAEKYHFSQPYMYNQLVLVGQKGSDVSASSFKDLEGKKIGVVDNYAYGDFEGAAMELVAGPNNQKNLENLLSGKIDYMLVDALLIQYMLKYQLNDVTQHLAIGQNPLLVKSLHLALSKNTPNAEEILQKFNEQIQVMTEDGSMNEILALNWIRADVDGDGKMELVLGSQMAGTEAPKNIYGLMMDDRYREKNEPNRYYIDGKLYEDWDNVPKSYKLDLVEDTTPSESDAVVKLKF